MKKINDPFALLQAAELLSELQERSHKLGISQFQLCIASGVPQDQISKIFNAKQMPTLATFFRLLTPLGLKLTLSVADSAEGSNE